MSKFVYFFDEGRRLASQSDPNAERNMLGGKGAGLAEMTAAGLPVPSGFTITTEACLSFYDSGRRFPPGLQAEVDAAMAELQKRTGKEFGSVEQSAARLRAQRGARLDARDDGYDPQPRAQRRDRRRPGAAHQQRALRLGRLPALHHDVLQRRARHREGPLRRADRGGAGPRRTCATDPSSTPQPGSGSLPASRRSCARTAKTFRRTSTHSSSPRSKPSSIPGTPSAPSTIAGTTRFPTIGARPST